MAAKTNFFEDRYAKVDHSLMEDGAKVDFGGGFFVTIRHVSARKVELVRTQKLQQMKIGNRNKQLTPEQTKELMYYVTAHGGIVTWEGGDAPEFTPETATQIFEDRPEFLEDVMTAMTSYETFREELAEAASGNSSKSSRGGSGTATS